MKHSRFVIRLLFFVLLITGCCVLAVYGQTLAPGSPGKDSQWATAGKQGVGTSASLDSKVWFTLAQGAMTEVYYPDVTVANVHLLQFVVVDPRTKKVETEQMDAIHEIEVLGPDSLTFQQINTAKSGNWKITKTYTTDVERDSVLIRVKFEAKKRDLKLYVYYDPSLGNSGMHDSAQSPLAEVETVLERMGFDGKRTNRNELLKKGILAQDKNGLQDSIASVILFSSNISELTNGFYGVSDGMEQLRKFGKITKHYYAERGNAVQMARIDEPSQFTVSIGFANGQSNLAKALGNADKSLRKGFEKCFFEYEKGWKEYAKSLPGVEPKYQAQFNMAAMILKAHEDKTSRGANIASLTVPWGGGDNANENNVGGYHLVWSRDLYQVATAFIALGDRAAADRALDFLFKVQQKPDGSFPQNSWLDGKPFWGSLQMDEVAFPLILAYQLGRNDKQTYENHIKRSADFLVKNGPVTPQERWEERSGYSPSTIAAEIAGLVCAADIANINGDHESAKTWLKIADEWQANIEKWTVTTNGKYGDGNYYLRISQKGEPNAGDKIDLGNGAGQFDEREIVDAGFLELVRLGIKSPDDPIIQKSLKVIDEVIRVRTPNGDGFYRYNHDGYGEMDDGRRWNWDGKYTGKGRLWALLSGERGQYEIALSENAQGKREISRSVVPDPKLRLDAMLGFANDGLMIPEQVWDSPKIPRNFDKQFVPELKFGEGTGSATPLAWSMAQFIRLAVNLKEGRNLDTPKVVYDRYVARKRVGKEELVQSGSLIPNQVKIKDVKDLSCERSYLLWRLTSVTNAVAIAAKEWKPLLPQQPTNRGVAFFYRGNAGEIEVVGDFTGWAPKSLKMRNVVDTDWKCIDVQFAQNARVEYKLIADGAWITDPLNPNKIDNGVGGENSVFTMPEYKPTEWDKGETPQLETIVVDSKVYREKREIEVYHPPVTDGSRPDVYPVLYIQDGTAYINRAKAVQIQQNLVDAKKIKSFIMVFIDYKDRMKEYWANDDYAKFLAKEIVPVIDSRYNTIKSRNGRAVMGASLGGITAVNVGLKYPQLFMRVGGQSSSFWIDNSRMIRDLEDLDGKTEYRFYFDDGTLEGVEDSRKAVQILKAKGFDVTYVEGEAGHNWTAWRDRLANAFIAIWK